MIFFFHGQICSYICPWKSHQPSHVSYSWVSPKFNDIGTKCLFVTRNEAHVTRLCLHCQNLQWPRGILFKQVQHNHCTCLLLAKLCKSPTGPQAQCSYRVMGWIRAGDSLWITTPLRFVLFTSQRQFFFHVFQSTWVTATGGHFLLWKSSLLSVPVMYLQTSAHARLATNNQSAPRICWHHRF